MKATFLLDVFLVLQVRYYIVIVILFCKDFALYCISLYRIDSAYVKLVGYNLKDSQRRHVWKYWHANNISYTICGIICDLSPF